MSLYGYKITIREPSSRIETFKLVVYQKATVRYPRLISGSPSPPIRRPRRSPSPLPTLPGLVASQLRATTITIDPAWWASFLQSPPSFCSPACSLIVPLNLAPQLITVPSPVQSAPATVVSGSKLSNPSPYQAIPQRLQVPLNDRIGYGGDEYADE